MIEILLVCFVGILTILGITEFLGYIRCFLKRPKKKPSVYSVFFLGEGDIATQVDYIISESIWHGKRIGEYRLVIVPNLNLVQNRAKIEKNYNIVFCDFHELKEKIKSLGDDFYAKRN